MQHQKKILICGPIAPPAGGISIHIQRLTEQLRVDWKVNFIDESHKIKKGIFNIRSFNLIGYIKAINKCDLLFIHSGNKLFKIIHILTGKCLFKPVLISIHGYGKKRNWFFRKTDEYFYNLADKIILVNNEILQKINLDKNKCVERHAFIPPLIDKEPALPDELYNLIQQAKADKRMVICGNASRLDQFMGKDLYGLDMMLELCLQLKNTLQTAPLFVFTVSSLDAGKVTYDQATEFIRLHQLENDFILLHASLSFSRLISISDLMIRPTATDGDSLSIRESLFLQKITIASDAVKRPDNCIIFKNRDHEDLYKVCKEAISRAGNKSKFTESKKSNEHYMTFYETLFNELIK